MAKLYIMCGVGFSGKTTLAKKIANHLNIPIVSTDDMFMELGLEKDNEEQWANLLKTAKHRIENFLENSKSVVYDSTNVKLEDREELRNIAKKSNSEVITIYLDAPEELIIERQSINKKTGERHDPQQKHLDAVKRDLEVPTNEEGLIFLFTTHTELNAFLEQLPK